MSVISNYIDYNGGFLKAIKKFIGVLFKIVRDQGAPGLYRQWQETKKRMRQIDFERSRISALSDYQRTRRIRILSPQHTAYIAYMLDMQFRMFDISSEIIIDQEHVPDKDVLYLVICPQVMSRLPLHRISFQMEQSTSQRWFTPKYLKILSESIAVMDYNTDNIKTLQTVGVSTGIQYFYPVHPAPNYLDYLASVGMNLKSQRSHDFDISFYGDINCERRAFILDALSKVFRVQVLFNVFGEDLYNALLRSKVVLNIHYYEPALLETTRICECISLGIPVVSEMGGIDELHDDFDGMVKYVESGDVGGIIVAVSDYLDHYSQLPRPRLPYQNVRNSSSSLFSTGRFLLGCGLIEPSGFLDVCVDFTFKQNTPICLSLPETPIRRAFAMKSSINQPVYFDGLRHLQGWKGCALSYWYLLNEARRQQLKQVEIYEDDCQFPPGISESLDIVRDYLGSTKDNWDIFSGLVTSIPDQAVIYKIESYRGIRFVHLNKTLGTVYNIFNNSIFDHLCSWDISNNNAATNTIDKYLSLKKDLRVVTCIPYIVGHAEDIDSTLWGFGNSAYGSLINSSAEKLEELVNAFELSIADSD